MPKDFAASLFLDKDEILNLLLKVDSNSVSDSSNFFNRFGFSGWISSGNYGHALHSGRQILELIHDLDEVKYTRMHKGTVYYWMGMAAYMLADFQTAIYLMDAAVSEDAKNDPAMNDTPAKLFFRLESNNPNQAARQLTQDAEKQLAKHIDEYNKIVTRYNLSFDGLKLDDLRIRILEPAVSSADPGFRSLASTLITYFIEFDYRHDLLKIRPEAGTNEPFFFHLIKGCLLLETLLKKNPSLSINKSTLGAVLKEKAVQNKLGLPNDIDISTRNLSSVLQTVDTLDDHPASAIAFTGKLRNALTHNLGWPDQLTRKQYIGGFFLTAIAIIHTIAIFYKGSQEKTAVI